MKNKAFTIGLLEGWEGWEKGNHPWVGAKTKRDQVQGGGGGGGSTGGRGEKCTHTQDVKVVRDRRRHCWCCLLRVRCFIVVSLYTVCAPRFSFSRVSQMDPVT